MSLFKFEKGDVIRNTVVSYPKNKFLFYDGNVVYNDHVQEIDRDWSDDDDSDEVTLSKYIPSGHVSLYELNIDRPTGSNDEHMIRPFVKAGTGWQPTAYTGPVEDIMIGSDDGDGNIYGSYPLSASISCDYYTVNSASVTNCPKLAEQIKTNQPKEGFEDGFLANISSAIFPTGPWTDIELEIYIQYLSNGGNIFLEYSQFAETIQKHSAAALENTLNFYKNYSKEFDNSKLYSDDFNIISIPSIFYGNKINPGSTRLELIVTGSQSGNITLTDSKKNGELLDQDGALHGVILYNEGFVILTGNEEISNNATGIPSENTTSWRDFAENSDTRTNLAWSIEFEGVSEIPTMTMFTHAKKNELNHSNNPSFLKTRLPVTSSSPQMFREVDDKEIKNITKTDLLEEEPIYSKETYISKIAIYDDQKKVIGYARLARPIRKSEERDLTFKLKIDL